MKKVCIVMGSDSDLKVMEGCINKLESFGVPFDVRVISAHRTPAAAEKLAKNAAADGYGVIIAAAGKAAHLGGVLAAYTTLPVIGVPIRSSFMGGLDAGTRRSVADRKACTVQGGHAGEGGSKGREGFRRIQQVRHAPVR